MPERVFMQLLGVLTIDFLITMHQHCVWSILEYVAELFDELLRYSEHEIELIQRRAHLIVCEKKNPQEI